MSELDMGRIKRKKIEARNKIAQDHVSKFIFYALLLYKSGEKEKAIKLGKLARSFVKNFGISFKRLDKFFYCNRCKRLIYPGINARIRVRSNRFKHLSIKCQECGNVKRMRL
ncbi:MAG: hypothetical protein ACP6IP_09795 [Candidatus Njordarchaeia archaeon]